MHEGRVETVEGATPQARRIALRRAAERHSAPGRRLHALVTTATRVAAEHWKAMEKAANGTRPRSRSERGTRIETWRETVEGLVRTHGYLAGAPRGARVVWDARECEALAADPCKGWIGAHEAHATTARLLESEAICRWALPIRGAVWLIDEGERMGTREHAMFQRLCACAHAGEIAIIVARTGGARA